MLHPSKPPWRSFPNVTADFIRDAINISVQNGMMTRDLILTWFLVATFVLGIVSISAQLHATARLAKWLYHEHRDVWQKLGCPGTSFFNGDPDNAYLRRISALQKMHRMMPLHAYRRELGNEAAQRILLLHRVAGVFSMASLALFFIGIIYGVARDHFDSRFPHPNRISPVAFSVTPSTLSHQPTH